MPFLDLSRALMIGVQSLGALFHTRTRTAIGRDCTSHWDDKETTPLSVVDWVVSMPCYASHYILTMLILPH
jgi:hypothetical protein